jgi:hypothetical protein
MNYYHNNQREPTEMTMQTEHRKRNYHIVLNSMLQCDHEQAFNQLSSMCADDTGLSFSVDYKEKMKQLSLLKSDTATKEDPAITTASLKEDAFNALHEAVSKMYKYAAACELGPERTKAFAIHQAARISPLAEG